MIIPLSRLELIVDMRQNAYSNHNHREKGEKKEMNKKEKNNEK